MNIKKERIALPALRGRFGNWIYYSCLFPLPELAQRVSYAKELHTSPTLSREIQRVLDEGKRARDIAKYLATQDDRFFSSLVLAVYGGQPTWLEVNLHERSGAAKSAINYIPEPELDSLGLLELSGREKIFALDGQHRLAGIRKAIAQGIELESETVPVLLVGHYNNLEGLQRTRRLFTTLNKTAVAVKKKDIIILDEDDAMAITTRRLIEHDNRLKEPRIAIIYSPNIPESNKVCFTTIGNLYDTLKILISGLDRKKPESLRFNRPSDDKLDEYYHLAEGYFSTLSSAFPPLSKYFKDATPDASSLRHANGGHILFRPIGMEIIADLFVELARKGIPNRRIVALLKKLPTNLNDNPYAGIIWDPRRKKIHKPGKTLAKRIFRHMFSITDQSEEALLDDCRKALLGIEDLEKWQLPKRILS